MQPTSTSARRSGRTRSSYRRVASALHGTSRLRDRLGYERDQLVHYPRSSSPRLGLRYPDSMSARWLLALPMALGCGGPAHVASTDAGPEGSATQFELDGSALCGALECGPGTVCVTTWTGVGSLPEPNDAGQCQEGSVVAGGGCMPVTYQCRLMPVSCSPTDGCGCPGICAVPELTCRCTWPPTSQQFWCDCSQT